MSRERPVSDSVIILCRTRCFRLRKRLDESLELPHKLTAGRLFAHEIYYNPGLLDHRIIMLGQSCFALQYTRVVPSLEILWLKRLIKGFVQVCRRKEWQCRAPLDHDSRPV